MLTNTVKLLDVVALTIDRPEDNLWRGQVGTVVEILAIAICLLKGRSQWAHLRIFRIMPSRNYAFAF
jgi:hypothetical protein